MRRLAIFGLVVVALGLELRPADAARVFVTACRFRTDSERYAWLNTVVGVLEGVLDTVGVGGTAHGRIHECRATLT